MRLTISLPENVYNLIERDAKNEKRSKSNMIEKILSEYYQNLGEIKDEN